MNDKLTVVPVASASADATDTTMNTEFFKPISETAFLVDVDKFLEHAVLDYREGAVQPLPEGIKCLSGFTTGTGTGAVYSRQLIVDGMEYKAVSKTPYVNVANICSHATTWEQVISAALFMKAVDSEKGVSFVLDGSVEDIKECINYLVGYQFYIW